MPETSIEFYNDYRPALQDGVYKVTVEQLLADVGKLIQEKDPAASPSGKPFTQKLELEFKVEGPQFFLEENLIHSMYPPSGAKGDFMTDLPTLTIKRSTLPWERTTGSTGEFASNSWMHLLLIDEQEMSLVEEHQDGKLSEIAAQGIKGDGAGNTAVSYLSLDPKLSFLLPSAADLEYLSYARISGEDDGEVAVLMTNRLPRRGSNSSVYLVSLEKRYEGNSFKIPSVERIFLPFLYKWKFHANDDTNYLIPEGNTELPAVKRAELTGMLFHDTESFEAAILQQNPGLKDSDTLKNFKKRFTLKTGTFHGLLQHLAGGIRSFSYADSGNIADHVTSSMIEQGAIATIDKSSGMPQVRSWYRGPLQAASPDPPSNVKFMPFDSSISTLPQHSNELVLFDSQTKMKDISYAAAWEIGRLTGLNDIAFNSAFFKWKQHNAIAIRHKLSANGKFDHLPEANEYVETDLPDEVRRKFEGWRLLKGIPMLYIVPSLKMLPAESISFFELDRNWINCFISGAFSIGRTAKVDLTAIENEQYLTGQCTGFIINSRAVSGWPDFEVDVANKFGVANKLLRRDLLGTNTALFLFEGQINSIAFHLHPGKMHSGFLLEGETLKKNILPEPISAPVNEHNIVAIADLAKKLSVNSVAEFAGKMIENVPKVVFNIN